MRIRFGRRAAGLAGAGFMALLGATVVYAAWGGTGTGSGVATAMNQNQINGNIQVGCTNGPSPNTSAGIGACSGTPDLFPGKTHGTLLFNIVNNNPFNLTFDTVGYPCGNSLNASTCGSHVFAGGTTNCPLQNSTTPPVTYASGYLLSVDTTVTSITAVTLGPGNPSTTAAVSVGTVSMDTNAPTACQGLTFGVPISVTGH